MNENSSLLKEIYYNKLKLLLFGLKISEIFYSSIERFDIKFNKGRKGGAGPAGGRYFIFENNSVVNVSLLSPKSENSTLELIEIIKEDERPDYKGYYYCKIIDRELNSEIKNIRLIPSIEDYNLSKNLNNANNKQIALIHGENCLASTIEQKCIYWKEGSRCKFCGIELSLKNNQTIKQKSADQLIKSIRDAKKLNRCEHITLTSGTLEGSDKGANNYIEKVSKIKQSFPNLPIHIQIEPLNDYNLYKKLKDAGVDTIGIHIEIIEDEIRKEMTPGKSQISYNQFIQSWKECVKIFGISQVSTFILMGFGEDIENLLKHLDKIIEIGVIPFIVPVRIIPGVNFKEKPFSFQEMVEIHNYVAEAFIKYDIDPSKNKAGCVKCSGCSAILDAYNYFKSISL